MTASKSSPVTSILTSGDRNGYVVLQINHLHAGTPGDVYAVTNEFCSPICQASLDAKAVR
jgi:hypothetical protein